MQTVRTTFQDFWESILAIIPQLSVGLLILLIFILLGLGLKRVINSRLQKRWNDTVVANFLGGAVKWIFISIGIIIALHLVGFGGIAGTILAGASVSALIIGFAFKDIAENFLAGILLAVNRPFRIGDIIECEGQKGPVKKLDLRSTHIRTADGRDIYLPNAMIVKNVFVNYTKDGLLRQEFLVGLDTYDDLTRAREVVLGYFGRQDDVLQDPRADLQVVEIGESSVNVKILFWVDILRKRDKREQADTGETVRSRVMREIKELLLQEGFNLPSVIVEHKMYREDDALKIDVSGS